MNVDVVVARNNSNDSCSQSRHSLEVHVTVNRIVVLGHEGGICDDFSANAFLSLVSFLAL